VIENYYELLSVSPEATAREIKAAYRREAMKWHPDRNGGSAISVDRFKRIQEACRVLSSPLLRASYDARLHVGRSTAWTESHAGTEARADDADDPTVDEWWATPPDLNESWRRTFRRPRVGIGLILFLVIVLINILRWLFPNGL